jgi:hypothetical protein
MVGGQRSKITDHKVGYKENGNTQSVFIATVCHTGTDVAAW